MEEREVRNKFWKGVVAGALVTALFGLVAVGLAAGIWVVAHNVGETAGQSNQAAEGTAAGTLDMEGIRTKLTYMQQLIDKFYLFDEEDYMEGAEEGIYTGFVYSLKDPYSTYYSAEEYESVSEDNAGEYCGIGVQVSQNVNTGIITVVKVFKDSPAREAGMLPGDIIYTVADIEATGVDLSLLVSDYIKGEEGTTVPITVYRESEGDYVEMEVYRRMVENPTVESDMLEEKIGYISISAFEEVSFGQFKSAYDELEKQGMKGLVIDLRNNGGGIVQAAEDISDYLLSEDCTIVSFKGKGVPDNTYYSDDDHEAEVPVVVLVNDQSASASEVLTGALKDNGAAIIVGTRTFGKGIAQGIFTMADGSALKLTTAYYYTPSGECIHEIGIEPDIEVELKKELKTMIEVPKEEDNQLAAALGVLTRGEEAVKEELSESAAAEE